MTTRNALYFDGMYASLAYPSGLVIHTTACHEDRYVRIDDGRLYPQLCVGGATRGNTLIFTSAEQLARACNAKLYKTKTGFDRAVARMSPVPTDERPWWLECCS